MVDNSSIQVMEKDSDEDILIDCKISLKTSPTDISFPAQIICSSLPDGLLHMVESEPSPDLSEEEPADC